MKKIFSIFCFFFAVASILQLTMPTANPGQIPFTILFFYIFTRGGIKLWTNNISKTHEIWKIILIYIVESIVSMLISIPASISFLNSQEVVNWLFVIILIVLTRIFKPTKIIDKYWDNKSHTQKN